MKKILSTTAIIACLSTTAFAGTYTHNNDDSVNTGAAALAGAVSRSSGGDAIQGQRQGQVGVNASEIDNKSGVNKSGNSDNELSGGDIDIDFGDSTTIKKANRRTARTAYAPIALSNDKCAMGNSLAIQGKDLGASAGGSVQSTDCVANSNAIVVSKLLAGDANVNELVKAELCTGKQHREAFEAAGIAKTYCVDKNTYLGLKPIVSGIKELILSPITLIKWIIKA